MAILGRSGRPLLASVSLGVFGVAGIANLGGALGALFVGNSADMHTYSTTSAAFLALVFAIDARWPPTARHRGNPALDDREGPPVQGDVR